MPLSLTSVRPYCVVQPAAVLGIGLVQVGGACLELGCEVKDGGL